MNCPSCGAKDAYQGFNYRDGQVDCVNKRCVQYNEKHAKAIAGAVDPDDTKPGRKTSLPETVYGKHLVAEEMSKFVADEDLEKLWDSVFGKVARLDISGFRSYHFKLLPKYHFNKQLLRTGSQVEVLAVWPNIEILCSAPDLGVFRPACPYYGQYMQLPFGVDIGFLYTSQFPSGTSVTVRKV